MEMSNVQNNLYLQERRMSLDGVANGPPAILPLSTSNPDLLSHPPITSQPTRPMSQSGCGTPWTYTPSGPLPMDRTDYYGSSASMNCHNVVHEKQIRVQNTIDVPSEIPHHAIVSMQSSSAVPSAGSRDWSRGLFGAFQDYQKSKEKCSAFKTFCHECWCVPCMMCSVAKSLGDKSYLPFIPGTGAAIRFKVRILGGIEGSIAEDCLVTSCCCPCAVCQMHKEIDDIGLAPT